jgi:hypothetical protein
MVYGVGSRLHCVAYYVVNRLAWLRHSERVSTMGNAKKARLGKAIAAQVVTGVLAATGIEGASPVADMPTGDVVTPVTPIGNGNKYLAASKVPTAIADDNGNTYTIGNKRALACAMYLLCCEKLGVKPSARSNHALALSARLLPLCGCGYSKHKADALKGGEVRSNGMKGYADFAVKHKDAVKLMPSGERYAFTEQAMPLARATFTLYAKVEGYDSYLLACGGKPSVDATPATDASTQG